jgi:MFS superfamily sulfate permease-like transporter
MSENAKESCACSTAAKLIFPSIFAAFPLAIVAAMMMLVGIEMIKFARDLRFKRQLIPVAVTLAGSLLANMAVGFAAGLAVHYLLLGKKHRHADTQR